MSEAMFAARTLTDPHVAIRWHEAVALVLATADEAERQHTGVPEIDDLALSTTGAVRVLVDTPSRDYSVPRLGHLLDSVLQHTAAPEELRALAGEAMRAFPTDPVGPWLESLSFFERPDREGQLVTLAERAAAARERQLVDAELRRIKGRTSAPATPRRNFPWQGWRRSHLGWAVSLSLGAVTFGTAAWSWRGGLQDRLQPTLSSWRIELRNRLEPAWNRLSTAVATRLTALPVKSEAPPSAESEPERPAPSPRPRAVVREATNEVATASQAAPSETMGRTVLPMPTPIEPQYVGHMSTTAAIATTGGSSVPEQNPPDEVVYSATDADVNPPVLLSRSIPSKPSEGFGDGGVFDIVVDERGYVERVDLVSPSHRFQERMLVAAAKAWRFQPARLNGRAVKYRTQVHVNW